MKTEQTSLTIALDVMGGDNAPNAMMVGAELALQKHPNIKYILCGDKEVLEPYLEESTELANASTIIHTERFIGADEKPSVALRQGKDSSMRLAIEAVKKGEADAVVSAGNTGALMAISKLVLRTLPGIDRPAIASIFPTQTGRMVFLDMGANLECDANNLIQFAMMGDAFARSVFGILHPKVGILNIGSEEMKGHEYIREAAETLKKEDYPVNFYGYVEGDSAIKGIVDVVVTDGFTGNVALKIAEGTASFSTQCLKQALTSSLMGKIGGFFAKPSIKRVFKRLDPRLHNGAMFVGLNGIAVKSHGGSDEVGNENAICVAYNLAANNINQQIIEELSQHKGN